MPIAKKDVRNSRLLLFAVLALPLAYLFVAGAQGLSLLALLGLSIVYLALKPFTVSVRGAIVLLVVYLAVSGLLGFSQPLFSQSWPVFSTVILLSALLQPAIFVLALDSIVAIFGRRHRDYDMAVVVLLWLSTLVVTFGSSALFRGMGGRGFVDYLFVCYPLAG